MVNLEEIEKHCHRCHRDCDQISALIHEVRDLRRQLSDFVSDNAALAESLSTATAKLKKLEAK